MTVKERIKNIENTSSSFEKGIHKKGRKMEKIIELLPLIFSLLSIVIAVYSYLLSQKEYEYKINPEYNFFEKISIENEEIKVKDFKIEISKENNLENIYIY